MSPQPIETTLTHKFTGADYGQIFEAEFDPRSAKLAQGGGTSDRMRHDRVIETHVSMGKTGWEKATVINMHLFPLRHGMGNIGEITIPKKKAGEPYAKYVIDKYRISMRDLGDAKFIPETVLPVQIAEDVALTFKEYGGVFWYRGTGDPDPEMLKVALDQQIEFYRKEFEKGMDFWHRYKQVKLISDHMRNAARELYALGLIEEEPEWLKITKVEGGRKVCDNCGNDVKKTAKTCSYCGYIIDLDFYNANKDRFQATAGAVKSAPAQLKPAGDEPEIEDFMNTPDPDALNQVKALDTHLASKLPDEFKGDGPKPSNVGPRRKNQ